MASRADIAPPWRAGIVALCALMPAAAAPVHAPAALHATPVVLLHGLARSPASMNTLQQALERAGYRVCNVGYPSRGHAIETLAREHVAPAVQACIGDAAAPVHFITHSMGGILVRQLAADRRLTGIQRVVMLAPPNRGSEVIDELDARGMLDHAVMPAARQLGTASGSLTRRLGRPTFELGIVAGTRSMNPLLSLRIPGPDDGKVSVESARLEGAADFLALPVSHVFIMRDASTIRQTLHFLEHGRFAHDPAGDAIQPLARTSPAR